MVRDAEANAAEDKKRSKLVQARNQADALVQRGEVASEHGDKLDAGEKGEDRGRAGRMQKAPRRRGQGRDRGQDRGADGGQPEARRKVYAPSRRRPHRRPPPGCRTGRAGASPQVAARGGRRESVDAEFTGGQDKK